jgi:alpha-aminoadipate carrier protein LysW
MLNSSKEEPIMTANCPECDAAIALADDAVEGEILVCPDCAAELEVTAVNPPALALAPEVGEDWGE